MATWPAGLNHYPMRDSMELLPHDEHIRTDWEYGPQRVRRRYTSQVTRIAFQLQLKPSEFEEFKTFYHDDLTEGTAWFTMPIYSGNVYDNHTVRFLQRYTARPKSGGWWEVSISLEVKDWRIDP